MSRILIVDDEPSICWALECLAEKLGHEARVGSSAEAGLDIASSWLPDVLVLDVRLPGMDGLSAMQRFQTLAPGAPIIVITAFGDLATAVGAVRNGAFEYVIKPFNLDTIRRVILRALTHLHPAPAVNVGEELLGRSPAMQEVFRRIALAAHSRVSVLIQGESGVGKELVAHAIHRHGNPPDAPFVAVNVAALSPSLAEAELFGHVEGAFTGAHTLRKGLLVESHGGTLFLDEVAEIPLPLQVKLLRALDRGEVLPVGADSPVAARFRVIAATHRDLRAMVARGEFRHDLYYRLAAFEMTIPPLRDRGEDVDLLAEHFAATCGAEPLALSDEVRVEIRRRRWSGNVRELRHAIEHAVVVARTGIILPEHLPPEAPSFVPGGDADKQGIVGASDVLQEALTRAAAELLDDQSARGSVYDRWLEQLEPPLLRATMERFQNECAPAARVLGLHRTTLKRKLEQYGLETRG